ncbi:zinc-dependent metalloprotease [soil metagenome]
MMVRTSSAFLLLLAAFVISACGSSSQTTSMPPKDKDGDAPKKSIKAYDKVITKETVSDSGLFIVHRVDEKLYYEIPTSYLGKELLLVSRIAKTPQIGYGGEELGTQVIRWERKFDKVLLRTVSYENVAADSLPISRAVKASNFEEIIKAFPIQAYNNDTTAVVIDVTDLFLGDVGILTPGKETRTALKMSGLDKERSYIDYARSFPTNIEVANVITFSADAPPQNPQTRTASFTMHHSMVQLPEQQMTPRLADPRVGFFALYQTDYGRPEPEAVTRQYILRWRLEPKDTAAFLRGELVEPIKPITWYLDPATPLQWRKWLRIGVERWNEAFAAAGFKNAIRCIDAPTKEEDSTWAPEDARYSVIRYYPSSTENAYGPQIHDPRTGEILESDIGWFHNIIKRLTAWYYTQAVADPRSHKLPLPDSVLGELVSFVATHEVGHTLGYPHNMKASNAYAVDSLRSPTFTSTHGTAPSIMDYARNKYIAQPGDGVTNFYPRIGEYDLFVTKWGYRPIIGAMSSDAEEDTLHQWARAAETDKALRFGAQQWMTVDPTSQMEDLGDDAIKASTLGIENIKRAVSNLYDAAYKDAESFEQLGDVYGDVLGQWGLEMGHVASILGGVEIDRKVFGVTGNQYTPIARDRQKAAVDFIAKNVFVTPTYLLEPRIIGVLSPTGYVERISSMQMSMMRNLMSNDKLVRLIAQQAQYSLNAYSVGELFVDVDKAIFGQGGKAAPDYYARALQRAFVQTLIDKTAEPVSTPGGDPFAVFFRGPNVYNTDVRAAGRSMLVTILARLKKASGDESTKAHHADLALQIERALATNK